MTTERLKELFEVHEDEFLKFDNITDKRSSRADICAFILLNDIIPGTRDMVASAEHDVIYLETDIDALAARATEEQVLELVRCGVHLEEETESLVMFV